MNTRKLSLAISTLVLAIVAGCAKKPVPTPVAQPPPPPRPTASISANPANVEKGGSTQLTWRTENANDASIEGIGSGELNGSKTVTPNGATTYKLSAKGP